MTRSRAKLRRLRAAHSAIKAEIARRRRNAAEGIVRFHSRGGKPGAELGVRQQGVSRLEAEELVQQAAVGDKAALETLLHYCSSAKLRR